MKIHSCLYQYKGEHHLGSDFKKSWSRKHAYMLVRLMMWHYINLESKNLI